ncbi:MAG TPA: cupredoxin domain-containing protein [Aestuariivirga sp.]|nr:cupredoxin domain-containing protein [Aestuariivirga sp.]
MSRFIPVFAALGVAFCFTATPALADDLVTYEITLKDQAFTPAEIKVPAGKAFMIKMNNANAAAAELESHELQIEKVAAGNSSIMVRVKALEPGTYPFVDEFQEDVAKGQIVAE